jgi:hypothetical protein
LSLQCSSLGGIRVHTQDYIHRIAGQQLKYPERDQGDKEEQDDCDGYFSQNVLQNLPRFID